MAVRAVRGAIQIEKNDAEKIEMGVVKLIKKLVGVNNIEVTEIISIMFSQTSDLDALNPAAALRTIGFGETPLFCTREPDVVNSMNRVIRVLMTVETDCCLNPVYLEGAEKLRSDLKK